jgi:N-acetylneuraminate synthase
MTESFFRTNPYIIAEIGACHDSSFSKALTLIRQCAAAGADAVKFQCYEAARLATRRHAEQHRAMYARYQVPHEWLRDLAHQAHSLDIALVLSVFDQSDLAAVGNYADALKISSFEADDLVLVEACTRTGKPVVVSTGMTSGEELRTLRTALKLIDKHIKILHCVSAYPTSIADLHLSTIREYRLDGFSDHSRHTLTGALAVSQGATILEVHVRANSTPPENPDYPHSLDIAQLFEYVRLAILTKKAIGEPKTEKLDCEAPCAAFKVRTTTQHKED